MKSVSLESLRGLKLSDAGLSPADVQSQRALFGANDIVETIGNRWWVLFLDTVKDPMIWFLIAIGSVFLLVGEVTDGITLLVAILPLVFMDAFLHWRTQASTAGLKQQLSSRVHVVRQSVSSEIDSRELVPGDLLLVHAGMLLPADGVFQKATDLQVDESVLTGESFPIQKSPLAENSLSGSHQGDVRLPNEVLGYAGTRVLSGTAWLRVILTGTRTTYGEIVQSVARLPQERTPLQKSISKLVEKLIYVSVLFCVLLAVVRRVQGYGWLDALMSAATLAVAAIPEEFPVVFAFYLGVGVYRLARRRALVRRAVSVENIGRVSCICTDKTGTITVGRLTLTHLDPAASVKEETLLVAALGASGSREDPMDLAIQSAAKAKSLKAPTRLGGIPFTEGRKREVAFVSVVDHVPGAYLKGAPETLLAMSALNASDLEFWRSRVSHWARSGHKVIGVAQAQNIEWSPAADPSENLEFLGLLAFEDPPRPEVAQAFAYCRENKVRVLMITGDHPETSAAIAKDAGMTARDPVVLSAEEHPERFSDDYMLRDVGFLKGVDVVARCTPMQKLKIVEALRRAGELVAVTGDGVNDVPALKAADVGIAMGERGTRSAKEVSSIILADDNFSTLVAAIREGRQLFWNLRRSFEYLLLMHIPLVLAAALVPLFGYPLVFLPVHIVWLELVIHPTALLAFQTQAAGDVGQVNAFKVFFDRSQIAFILLLGGLVSVALAYGFGHGVAQEQALVLLRTKAIVLLTLWSAGISIELTRARSKAALVIAAVIVSATALLVQTSHKLEFLRLAPLAESDWLILTAFVVILSLLSRSLRSKLAI